jgi:deoxyribodipyrimidine photo-lyase
MPDAPRRLPPPPPPRTEGADPAVLAWVATHLGDLCDGGPDAVAGSPRFRGGQTAADRALAGLDLHGYADARSEVHPRGRRGATGLSPWIRHGLLPLPRVWAAAADAPVRDRDRFRDELLWQEYARHLYARLGPQLRDGLRRTLPPRVPSGADPWAEARADGMACLDLALDELAQDGWLVNQTRMWVASQWAVRSGADWREGEDELFRRLLDGSRAANRLGWQWVAGTATGRPYDFSRWQVERRAPGVCAACPRATDCPIEDWPEDPPLGDAAPGPLLRHDPDPGATAGPATVEAVPDAAPTAVWLTAESLGDADPALAAHPSLPAVFVFDAPLLTRLRLDARRLVFLAESLGDLAARREVAVWRGDVVATLGPDGATGGMPLAVTHAPVPGFRRRAAALPVVERHPWPWLRRPAGGGVASFSAWRGGDRGREGRGGRGGPGGRAGQARRRR